MVERRNEPKLVRRLLMRNFGSTGGDTERARRNGDGKSGGTGQIVPDGLQYYDSPSNGLDAHSGTRPIMSSLSPFSPLLRKCHAPIDNERLDDFELSVRSSWFVDAASRG